MSLSFASALSTSHVTHDAVEEVSHRVRDQLGATPDLAMLFVSHHHGPDFDSLLGQLYERLQPRHLLGCTGESIVGVRREVEEQPAISLWATKMPEVDVRAMHIDFKATKEGGSFTDWPGDWPEKWPAGAALFLLGEPYSFPADGLLASLAEDHPGVPVLGGMASGAHQPGRNRVFLNHKSYNSGAVAALVAGNVHVRAVVSQGCRPIGRSMIVTKSDANVILEMAGKPPLAQLQEMYDSLTPEEQQLINQGLHVGRVINEYQDKFTRGDFLIRNCVGADRRTGAIAVGDYLKRGQTVQFHIRDAASADDDLRELLATARQGGKPPQGALLFTCNGRGTRLFSEASHDAGVVGELMGDVPLAGFFAQGEIGPVGGQNFLHGFTACVALFSEV